MCTQHSRRTVIQKTCAPSVLPAHPLSPPLTPPPSALLPPTPPQPHPSPTLANRQGKGPGPLHRRMGEELCLVRATGIAVVQDVAHVLLLLVRPLWLRIVLLVALLVLVLEVLRQLVAGSRAAGRAAAAHARHNPDHSTRLARAPGPHLERAPIYLLFAPNAYRAMHCPCCSTGSSSPRSCTWEALSDPSKIARSSDFLVHREFYSCSLRGLEKGTVRRGCLSGTARPQNL